MKNLKELTFIENRRAVKLLLLFKIKIKNYYTNYKRERDRVWISTNLQEIFYTMKIANVNTVFNISDPGFSGFNRQSDIIGECLYLNNYDTSLETNVEWLDNTVNTAIGVYNKDFKWSVVRAFNPFFWISLLIKRIVFKIFDIFNFNNVISTKIVNFGGDIIPWLASIIYIMDWWMTKMI